jgi:hypothetical protein
MMTTLDELRQARRTLRQAREQAHYLRHALRLVIEHIEDGAPQMAALIARQALDADDTGDQK